MREIPQLYRMQAIIEVVCDYYKIRPDQMKRRDRRTRYIWPRQVCAFFLRGITKDGDPLWSFNEISRNVGLGTHSTVKHSCKKVYEKINKSPKLNNDIDSISLLLDDATYSDGFKKHYQRSYSNIDMTSDAILIQNAVKEAFPKSDGFLETSSKELIYTIPRSVCVYFFKNIRHLSGKNIWTRQQIADMCNISYSTVNNYAENIEQELFLKGKYYKNIMKASSIIDKIEFIIPVKKTFKR